MWQTPHHSGPEGCNLAVVAAIKRLAAVEANRTDEVTRGEVFEAWNQRAGDEGAAAEVDVDQSRPART